MSKRYSDAMNSALLLRALLVALAAVVVVGIILAASQGGADGQKAVPLLFPLLGTFLGAVLAFTFSQYQESIKRRNEAKAALNRALFVLGIQHLEIRSFLAEYNAITDPLSRAFNLPANQPPEHFDHRQKMDELNFVLRHEERTKYLRLAEEQINFDKCYQMIRYRNEFYVNEVQPLMELHVQQGQVVSAQQLEQAFGPRIFQGAMNAANNAHRLLQATESSMERLKAEFHALAKELFPDDDFIKVNPE